MLIMEMVGGDDSRQKVVIAWFMCYFYGVRIHLLKKKIIVTSDRTAQVIVYNLKYNKDYCRGLLSKIQVNSDHIKN